MTGEINSSAGQHRVAEGSERSLIALLFVVTLTTGVMDAVSVLGLGHVFTANMTGNVVFLGFALAGVPDFSPWVFVVALSAFLVGAILGGRLGERFDARRSLGCSELHWLKQLFSLQPHWWRGDINGNHLSPVIARIC
jgi:uncharacterized membrane protein YoaK (UPF0700 family)